MTSSDRPSPHESASTFDPEPLLCVFEQAWQAGDRPSIETLLAQLPGDDAAAESIRRCLLEEMVKIDLEYRWRGVAAVGGDNLPPRPLVEDYLQSFPVLGPLERLSPELIGEEYRVRRLWGDAPNLQSYFARFPAQSELPALLARIDAELAERAGRTTLPTGEAPRQTSSPPRVAPEGYELLEELGRGGMGVVYKARQLRLNRLVAIKMIRAGDEAGPAALARFRTEAEAAARVQHPNIVQVYEVGEKDGQPYCVMEYINGGSLSRCLAGSPLGPRAAVHMLETLSRGVQAIHDCGILHRDLKPANVLLHLSHDGADTITADMLHSPSCVPKIGDFGLAKPAESAGLTQTGAVLGTPSYMAPEQADSRSDFLGPAADVYGLGAIFYELLTGRPPFRGVTVLETLEQVRRFDPLPPRQLQPAVPRDVEIICLKCLQKEPAKRYASAAALADDLDRFRQNRPILARPAGRWERARKWARRRPALATLVVAVFLGILAALSGGIVYTSQLRAAHQQTDRSYRKSLEAVERMLVRMGAQRMEAIPGTEKAQEDALKDAIRLYQELLEEQEKPDPELYARTGAALSYLGNRQMGLGRSNEAENNCRRSLELLDSLPDDLRNNRAWQQQSAFARWVLANILASKNRRAEAERLYLQASDILTPLDDEDSRSLLSNCYNGLAGLSSDPAQKTDHYRQAAALREYMHKKHPDSWEYRNSLAESLFDLARNALFQHRADEAEALFQRSIALLEPLVSRSAKSNDQPAARLQSRKTLLHCYTGLGMLWGDRGAVDKAELFHGKAIAVSEELVRLYPDPGHRQALAQGYLDLGTAYQVSEKRPKAAQMYRKAAAVQEALVRDHPAIAVYRQNLASTYCNLVLLGDQIGAKESLAVLQKGRDLLEPLIRADPDNLDLVRVFGILCKNQALVLYYQGKIREALPWYDRAVETLTAAHRRHPADSVCKSYCGETLGSRAVAWTTLGEHKKALADWNQILAIVDAAEADKYRSHRAWTLSALGDHHHAAKDIEQWLHHRGITPDERYNCACIFSRCSAAADKDPQFTSEERSKTADAYATRALELLTQLQHDGYFGDKAMQQHLDGDEDLIALRPRSDFKLWRDKLSNEQPSTKRTKGTKRTAKP